MLYAEFILILVSRSSDKLLSPDKSRIHPVRKLGTVPYESISVLID